MLLVDSKVGTIKRGVGVKATTVEPTFIPRVVLQDVTIRRTAALRLHAGCIRL